MVKKSYEQEIVRIIDEVREIKKQEVIPDEETIEENELQENLKEELNLIEEESEGESLVPILEADELPQGESKNFSLDHLKDMDVPTKNKKKGKKEEMYSSKKADDFYAGGATSNDLYKGLNPDQGLTNADFYEQSSLDSFYNNSSGSQFYVMSSELEEKDNNRIETHSNLEEKFNEKKKDDLMFRS